MFFNLKYRHTEAMYSATTKKNTKDGSRYIHAEKTQSRSHGVVRVYISSTYLFNSGFAINE